MLKRLKISWGTEKSSISIFCNIKIFFFFSHCHNFNVYYTFTSSRSFICWKFSVLCSQNNGSPSHCTAGLQTITCKARMLWSTTFSFKNMRDNITYSVIRCCSTMSFFLRPMLAWFTWGFCLLSSIWKKNNQKTNRCT